MLRKSIYQEKLQEKEWGRWRQSTESELQELGKKDQAMQVLYKLRKEAKLFFSYMCWNTLESKEQRNNTV